MHPEIILSDPGKFPKCGMNLVPLKEKSIERTNDKSIHWKAVLIIVLVFSPLLQILAHNGKKHKQDSVKAKVDSAIVGNSLQVPDSTHHDHDVRSDESKVKAGFEDFPTLHPLIVHFAIALIIIAALLQVLNVFLMKREVGWIITGILFIGVMAAWLAGRNFHPHTHGISAHAQLVLDQHDVWADRTIYSGFAGLLLSVSNKFFLSTRRWSAAIVAVVLMLSAYSVACAGHYGSQLVHIEGVGPQGKFLELEHHH